MNKKAIAVAVLSVLSVTAVQAQPRGMNGCYMYEKDEFRGAQFTMGPNSSVFDFDARRGWNDEISSAWVTPNCALTLYEHSQFRGGGVFITFSMYDLKKINGGFNDKTSSAKCECT